MNLTELICRAKERRASDIHLEPGLPPALRISLNLESSGEPVTAQDILAMTEEIVGDVLWPEFVQRRSIDLSRTFQGVRCRINAFHTARGIALAIRLLSSLVPTVERLNLHPDLKKLVPHSHGLILVSGATGSGKSSTLAALIQEINQTESRHIITLEHPIEYQFKPQISFIRQREVGRDTPSFEQGLLDAMREDPDVLMVGEMREPETMRLTLNASETGHLVFATIHSSTAAEALQRMISAFPSEIQNSVAAQLADCLTAVICQRLRFYPETGIRLPECEILRPTHAVKNFIRRGEFHQIPSTMETGADHGMWTFTRYRAWMSTKRDWYTAPREAAPPSTTSEEPVSRSVPATPKQTEISKAKAGVTSGIAASGRIEIEPDEGGLQKILRKLT